MWSVICGNLTKLEMCENTQRWRCCYVVTTHVVTLSTSLSTIHTGIIHGSVKCSVDVSLHAIKMFRNLTLLFSHITCTRSFMAPTRAKSHISPCTCTASHHHGSFLLPVLPHHVPLQPSECPACDGDGGSLDWVLPWSGGRCLGGAAWPPATSSCWGAGGSARPRSSAPSSMELSERL